MLLVQEKIKLNHEIVPQHFQPYCERFREGRKAAGVSSIALGQAIGMSPQAISQFERGLMRLDLEKFVAACDALHLNVRWVLKGLGDMFEGRPPASKQGRPAKRIAKQ